MPDKQDLLDNNREWANQIRQDDPEFFPSLAKGQQPEYLWFGCSDSRVPPEVITRSLPGDIFVHRNIANMVEPGDLSSQSVLQFAIEVLEIKHIIICGHYSCGGIEAAMGEDRFGLLDQWLLKIKKNIEINENKLASIEGHRNRVNRMCELNVKTQVLNVGQSYFVQRAWSEGKKVAVHGWIYDLEEGLLKDLNVSVDQPSDIG